ncbi:MAG TPA: transglycosylase domain-containing protein [Candidatus Limnocylindria bacterium]|nr:transglycosylase domain-containing protein [Candidatus Limnocylindria bacterium]
MRRRNGGAVRARLAVLPSILAAVLIAGVALATVGAVAAFAFFSADLPAPEELAKDPLALSTKVYDRTGTMLLYQFEVERREIVSLDQVPQQMIDATLGAEDKTFWTNPGVDVFGILRAARDDLLHRTVVSGASTITQQLVKQRIVGDEVSVTRKIKEAILSVEVTRTYSKKQILELYLNQIYYGNQAYGIKAAAETYFGKSDLSTLTLAESALLAGLPQQPSALDPSDPENVASAKARRAYVLGQMVDMGAITEDQAAAADAEPIKVAGVQITTITAPHFVFQVRDQLKQILGGNEAAVTRGGFKVITTLDMNKQKAAERNVKEHVEDLHGKNVWNAALVSIDPRNGEVLAYVGSVDYYNRDDPRVQGQFDVAGIGLRQPGSSFKMFNYLTALKKGATPATVVVDARTDFTGKADPNNMNRNTCGYCPENADLQYHGPVTMRQALRESRNVPAVKFLAQYSGIEDTIQTARDMGITTPIDPSQVGLSLTLGAQVVKLIDMTSAYGVLANNGVRVAPTFIQRVEDPRGKVVWEHKDYEQKQVVDRSIAWLMTDILKDMTDPAKDFIFGSWTNIGRPAALKTGTTDNLRDVYSVGYVPQLVTGIWMGNSNNLEMSSNDFSSAMGPGVLWRDYMKEVLADTPKADWERPANIVTAQVVVAPGAFGGYGSGLLPSSLSPFSMSENFIKGTQPARADDWFVLGCPQPDGTRKVALQLKENAPPTWQRYTDKWVADANAGLHTYGRYSWNVIGSQPCPSPSPSPSPSASPSATGPRPSGSGAPIPTPTFPPGITPPPIPTPTPPPGLRTPTPTP